MVCGRTVICGSFVVTVLVIICGFTFYYTLTLDGCDEGAYQCADASTCVPRRFVCNGHEDCPQGDDEDGRYCYNDNWDSSIIDKLVIPSLVKSQQGIHSDHNTSCNLTSVPKECLCSNQTWLKCSGVSSIPQQVSTNVTRMILANNSIRTLTTSSFAPYKLSLIHLDFNQISRLPPGVFAGQTKLKRLFISYNNLSEVESCVLNDAVSLKWLFVTHNPLRSLALDNLNNKVNLSWIDFSHNKFTLEGWIFPHMPSLKDLILDDNAIKEIAEFTFMRLLHLTNLNLARNSIAKIHKRAFRNLSQLAELDLSDNQLMMLDADTFVGLGSLSMLSLVNNPLQHMPRRLFVPISQLASLDMEGVDIDDVDSTLFAPLKKLKFLHLKKFYYCIFAPPTTVCRPDTDGVSTLDDLLGRTSLRVTVWAVGTLGCLGNVVVLWERFTARDDNRVLSLVVRNLAVADGLMSVYMLIIGARDAQYRYVYNQEAHAWMSSWSCTILGMLAMTSSEVTVMILVFMSLERFLLIAVPFAGYQSLNMKAAYTSLGAIWALGCLAAVVPVLHWRHPRGFYGTNGMCFPLHITDPYHMGWEYSAFIFLGINLFCLMTITVFYAGMFISIKRTRRATSLSTNVGEFEFVFRFFFIVLTDALCWAPIIVVKVLALSRVYIPAPINMWLMVFVLPVNSVVNPLLYTLTTPNYVGQIANESWVRAKQRFASRRQSSADTESSRASSNRNVMGVTIGKKIRDAYLTRDQRTTRWITSQAI